MVESADRDGVRVVTLRRPPVNAIHLEMVEAIAEAIAQAAGDPACAALVLTGQPGVFSAGIDTREVPAYDAEKRAAMLRAINRTILALYGLAKPAVAAISGHALGGALVFALACDMRLAARGPFQLGLTEARAGVPFPAGPLAVVQAELSPSTARLLMLTSLTAPPDSPLLHPGVIDRVLPQDALLDAALSEARQLASQPAHARVKAQLRAATLERLTRIAARDEEPMLAHWV
jgi:enoyl-CoA hydratase